MATFHIKYGNGKEEDVEASYFEDEKSFIDFYRESDDPLKPAVRTLRVQAAGVRRIETTE